MRKSGYAYHASAGESFDSVALSLYGDEKYAAEMIQANPAYSDRWVFLGGEEIRLPVIETSNDEKYAPWRT